MEERKLDFSAMEKEVNARGGDGEAGEALDRSVAPLLDLRSGIFADQREVLRLRRVGLRHNGGNAAAEVEMHAVFIVVLFSSYVRLFFIVGFIIYVRLKSIIADACAILCIYGNAV